ncbi:disease resistance protein RGA5 isoform X3 [Setaria viridis]|uniref:disease resistance protein RGA5 isoform X3 n=1 Tax=Setaria viridis TaxID=4556 RepID=UPI001493C035|nr:disease resistance protein RGA5-like isoform X3 [Setaria viridis]
MEIIPMFSSSLGAMGSLLRKLGSLLFSPGDQVPEPLKDKLEILCLLKQDLEEMIPMLMDLSRVEAPNTMSKLWMNEVRDLSYDIEDYIDKAVRPSYNTGDEIPFEIEEFYILVQHARERYRRYDLGRWASSPMSMVADGQVRLQTTPSEEATDLVGICDSTTKLINLLSNEAEQRMKVVSVLGPEGIGKTTLAKEVYHQMGAQFECRAFVRASKMPDARRLLRSIISQVHHHQRPRYGLCVQELIGILREHLQHKRYFIIIDGLWETTSWDIVYSTFPEDSHGSRILITTNIEEVALECCDYESDALFKMEPLSGNYSAELFFNKVFGFKHSEQLKENSEQIISTFGGLPLAIISIASILASRPDNLELWRHVEEYLSSRLRNSLTSEGMPIREIVGLSYNSLPHHLKTCLLYLSMYPEGYTFLKADLVKQWSAEGFIVAEEEYSNTDAECYLGELVCRGLIQPNHINIPDGVIFYTLHSTVFEIIRNMSIEENFTTVIDYSNNITKLSTKVRRLSLRFSNTKYATKPEGITLSSVRSLVFYGLVECLPWIIKFKVLRILILEIWGDQEELDLTGIDRLLQLRYVKITTDITVKLPPTMHGLQYLETLEIDARITTVPSDIVRLPSLLHLRINAEINLPDGIIHMISLRTLQSFDLSRNSEDNIRSLGHMTNLQDLHLTYSTERPDHLKRNFIALVSSLGKHDKLKSLILAPGASCTSIYLDCSWSVSSLPIFIQRLELLPPICIFSSLPECIGRLRKLCVLKIVVRELTDDDVNRIAMLQELIVLSLYVRQPTGERIIFNCAAFPVLKYFKFRRGILHLAFQEKAMPNLRWLDLKFNAHKGEHYDDIITGIENLLNIQDITVRIGAAPGAEEPDRIAAECALKDTLCRFSRPLSFSIGRVDSIVEEMDDAVLRIPQISDLLESSPSPGLDMHKLQQVVMKTRWLKPQEVLQILRNHELFMISHKLPQKPPSGSWFLINRRVLRYFRNDGFEWQKKENGKSVNETHERLKVDNMEALNCYYARGDKNPTFQRRIYWMLDPAYEHIVLLHYRDVPELFRNSTK